jgi:hypothetical protein
VNGWLDVAAGVALGLLVNECTEVSPWLAHKVVRWAAVIQRPDRAEEFAEARSATINDRPGKLFKLFTALGFLFAALAHRVIKRRRIDRSSLRGMLRVRVRAAGIASGLYSATWSLIVLFADGGGPAVVISVVGMGLFVIALLVFHMQQLRSGAALVCAILLPTALVASLWMGNGAEMYVCILTKIAPMYGIAQTVRGSLCDSRLHVAIGSVVAVSAVIATAAVVVLETMSHSGELDHFLGLAGLGVVGGLHVSVGLLVLERVKRKRDTVAVMPPGTIPSPDPA